jgi:energy-converting hydrogenase A subunit J
VTDGLKTFVLLYAFVAIFIGAVPFWAALVIMTAVLISLSFVCAITPMLSPFDSVTIQGLITGLMLVYVVCLWWVMP